MKRARPGFNPSDGNTVSESTVFRMARGLGLELFEADLVGLDRRSKATVVRALGVIKAGRRAGLSLGLTRFINRTNGYVADVTGASLGLLGKRASWKVAS